MLAFDIGANVGKWALSNRNTYDKIICVEAIQRTFNKLKKNTRECGNITCENYAVCNSSSNTITFYDCDHDTLSTMNKEWLTDKSSRFYNQSFKETRCDVISIDKLIQCHGVPDIIKIDTEGGEYDCVCSLSYKVDTICFEWASETNDSVTYKCLEYLFKLGYINFYIQNGDEYTFRPEQYYGYDVCMKMLSKTIQKKDWGMIWCT